MHIRWASFATEPNFATRRTARGRKAQGVRYERAVQEEMLRSAPHYIPSPWFVYRTDDSDELKWCQPDGLHIAPLRGRITIIEVKYQHTEAAWRQLWGTYAPVIAYLFPASLWAVSCVEVVKWYDPAVAFPGRVMLLSDPFMRFDMAATGVYIYNPSRNRPTGLTNCAPKGGVAEHAKAETVSTETEAWA